MKKLATALMTLLFAIPFVAAGDGQFIKFELTETSKSETPTEVKLSLPFSMLEALRPQFEKALSEIEFDGHEIDLKAIWQEVKNTGPNDYVEVRDEQGTVLVSTTATHIVIKIDHDEKMNISVPLALGDAFLGGQQINFDEVLDTLMALKGQDLLTISGDTVNARAWIE